MGKIVKVKIELLDEMLGMSPSDPEIYRKYISMQAPDAANISEEVAAIGVEDVLDKCKTIFPRDKDGCPIMWNYQVKGWAKDACGMLRYAAGKDEVSGKKIKDNESSKLTAYKKLLDGAFFVEPRRVRIEMPEGGVIGECQRPLRAQTAQGERVALANSETVPEGSTMTWEICLFNDDLEKPLIEWLNYGKFRGLGQWRNSGKGIFTYEILDIQTGVKFV